MPEFYATGQDSAITSINIILACPNLILVYPSQQQMLAKQCIGRSLCYCPEKS